MDIMEQLLCPQVCMDVEETPLELNDTIANDNHDDDSDDCDNIPEDVKINLLLEVVTFDPCQTPEKLTKDEEIVQKNLFETGPLVQFLKLHCTACNVHLGSAPINQFNRYIHPVLQVLLCKSCYDFYTSGDFEKDEDGSELYCRWCGQGGKVMCCSKCCFVFCQKCTRQNLGKKVLDSIKNSDDWICFACEPQQLVHIKVICTSLFEHIQNLISEAKKSNNHTLLKEDASLCCRNQKSNKPMKRKRSSSDDSTFDPYKCEETKSKPEPKKKTSILNSVLTTMTKPSKPMLSPPPLAPFPTWRSTHQLNPSQNKMWPIQPNNNVISFKLMKPTQMNTLPTQPILLCATTTQPVTMNNVQKKKVPPGAQIPQNFVPVNKSIRVIPTAQLQNKPKTNGGPNIQNVVPSSIANLVPGLKHEWFDQATKATKMITNNLNTKIGLITNEQKKATTIEHLAATHNNLQELMSTSVNSLIQIRKTLRSEFLSNLNKLKFQKSNCKPVFITRPESGKDDDVVLVNNLEDPLNIVTTSSIMDSGTSKGYIKVKPASSLLDQNHLKAHHNMFGDNEPIDLCGDDDDDDVSAVNNNEITLVNNVNDSEINSDDLESNVEKVLDELSTSDKPSTSNANDNGSAQTQVQNSDSNNEDKTNKEAEENEVDPPLDADTLRQIQRALAESKFESIVTENSAIKVSGCNLTEEELTRMLTVRVLINPKHREKLKTPQTSINNKPALDKTNSVDETIVPQDFEEMLSGSILINTSSISNKQQFGDIFSNFITNNKPCDSDSNVHSDNEESNKVDDSTSNNLKNTEDSLTKVEEEISDTPTSENIENKKGADINEDSCFFSEDGVDATETSETRTDNLNDQVVTRDSGIDVDTK